MNRTSAIERVHSDLPQIHVHQGYAEAAEGVWGAGQDLFEWLSEVLPRSPRTMETGLGVSTVLLAMWGAEHTCIVPFREEVEAVTAYCAERRISLSNVTFLVESSATALPLWKGEPLDLLLVDGSHGFPLPIIDWFYGAAHVRKGGIVVLDDINLPSVAMGLERFLRLDPRWRVVRETPKWIAVQRLFSGALEEDWTDQLFLSRQMLADRVPGAIAHPLRVIHFRLAPLRRAVRRRLMR